MRGMETTKPRPAPKLAHTWTARELNALKAAALALGGSPSAMPSAEEVHAFAADLPFKHAHVAEARYNPDHKRVEVTLHGGGIRFHVPVCEEAKDEEDPAAPTPKRTGAPAVLEG